MIPPLSHPPYRGRFAPSPTGPLHFGSVVAAVGSYLEARAHHGEWLLRIEDLDAPRVVPGAAGGILRTLESLGLEWDGAVTYQSRRIARYREALERLAQSGMTYPCACSRREVAEAHSPVYPGTCRTGIRGRAPRALRVRTGGAAIAFHDALQGAVRQELEREVGDFVLRRADGIIAYQLAVVVDDAEQGVSDVVRGADLLDSTPRQIYLQQLLGYPTPRYLHLPVAVNEKGEKLGKQTLAPAVNAAQPVAVLWQALVFLGQRPPDELRTAALADFWNWARANWSSAHIPGIQAAPVCSRN